MTDREFRTGWEVDVHVRLRRVADGQEEIVALGVLSGPSVARTMAEAVLLFVHDVHQCDHLSWVDGCADPALEALLLAAIRGDEGEPRG